MDDKSQTFNVDYHGLIGVYGHASAQQYIVFMVTLSMAVL